MALVMRGNFSGSAHSPTPSPVFGVHSSMTIPFGTYRNAMRVGVAAFTTAARANGGTIASRNGRANAAPAALLSKERRDMRLSGCTRALLFRSHLKWFTLDNGSHQDGQLIAARDQLLIDLVYGR